MYKQTLQRLGALLRDLFDRLNYGFGSTPLGRFVDAMAAVHFGPAASADHFSVDNGVVIGLTRHLLADREQNLKKFRTPVDRLPLLQLFADQFARQFPGIVNLSQCFEYSGCMNPDGPRAFIRLDIPIPI